MFAILEQKALEERVNLCQRYITEVSKEKQNIATVRPFFYITIPRRSPTAAAPYRICTLYISNECATFAAKCFYAPHVLTVRLPSESLSVPANIGPRRPLASLAYCIPCRCCLPVVAAGDFNADGKTTFSVAWRSKRTHRARQVRSLRRTAV